MLPPHLTASAWRENGKHLEWVWVKHGYPKWNPGKWKHKLKPAVWGGLTLTHTQIRTLPETLTCTPKQRGLLLGGPESHVCFEGCSSQAGIPRQSNLALCEAAAAQRTGTGCMSRHVGPCWHAFSWKTRATQHLATLDSGEAKRNSEHHI